MVQIKRSFIVAMMIVLTFTVAPFNLSKYWVSYLRYEWSALRNIRSITALDPEQYAEFIPSTGDIEAIKELGYYLMRHYTFTPDGLSQLFDSIDTPAACFKQAIDAPPLLDDCDGYHAALLYAVSVNHEAQLLSYVTANIVGSHTLLVFKHESDYYFFDNCSFGGPFARLTDVLADRLEDKRVLAVEFTQWNGHKWETGWPVGTWDLAQPTFMTRNAWKSR